MWIIVGLGNPGRRYARTRHNIGFRVVDELSERYRIPLTERESYSIGKGALEGCDVVLLKPLCFMNRSGLAVSSYLRRSGRTPAEMIVVHDDLDLGTGVVRIRRNGTSGGHRGIESIIRDTGSKDFSRVKVGIGRDRDVPVEEYVLTTFRSDEKEAVEDAVSRAADAVVMMMKEGIDKAMTVCNRSRKAPEPGE